MFTQQHQDNIAIEDIEWLYPASIDERIKNGWVYKLSFDSQTYTVKAKPVYILSFLRIPFFKLLYKLA